MIIKSMTWKYAGFAKLAGYLTKHRGKEEHYDLEVFHNLVPDEDVADIVHQFKENDTYRKKRKNGIALYHEVMSFHAGDTDDLSPEMLQDLANKYLEMRAPDALAFASVHNRLLFSRTGLNENSGTDEAAFEKETVYPIASKRAELAGRTYAQASNR